MKKISCYVLIICIMSCMTVNVAHADDALKKLGRGAANVLMSPMEMINGISEANAENGWIAAVTWGVLKGIFKTGVRMVVGAYEIVTFPIPFPKDYEPILTDPEFICESWD